LKSSETTMKNTLTLLLVLLLMLPVARASDTPKLSPGSNCEFPTEWFLYGMAERNTPVPDFNGITAIPATLDAGGLSLSAKATGLERCRRFLYLDLQARHGGAWSGRTAYLLTCIESDSDRILEVGAGAD